MGLVGILWKRIILCFWWCLYCSPLADVKCQLPFRSANTQRSSGRFSNIHSPFWLDSLFNVELSPGMVSATLLFSSAWPLSLTVFHVVLLVKSTLSRKATPLKTSCLYVASDLLGLSSETLTMSSPVDHLQKVGDVLNLFRNKLPGCNFSSVSTRVFRSCLPNSVPGLQREVLLPWILLLTYISIYDIFFAANFLNWGNDYCALHLTGTLWICCFLSSIWQQRQSASYDDPVGSASETPCQ